MLIQPATSEGRSSSLKIYGNGSMQIAGHPDDVEVLSRAAFTVVARVMMKEPHKFLRTMRITDRYVV